MREVYLNSFGDQVAKCLSETNDTVIQIFDCYDCEPAAQRSYLSLAEGQPVDFTLHNPDREPLVFAAIDNCILGSGTSRGATLRLEIYNDYTS
jgi:hypothetical protein